MQSISMCQSQFRSAAALLWVAGIMQIGARRVRAVANWLDGWLERRRLAANALVDFSTMTERDLLDIGLTRTDVRRVAWGASGRYQDEF